MNTIHENLQNPQTHDELDVQKEQIPSKIPGLFPVLFPGTRKGELMPVFDSAKSFYRKAIVYSRGDVHILHSYDTPVAIVTGGKLYRTWGGYSQQTMRHVNDFSVQYGTGETGKAWWDKLPVMKQGDVI